MKKIVALVCLWSGAFGQTQIIEEDYTTPVVYVVPLDLVRVRQIAEWLPEKPQGFGDPNQTRTVWDALYKSGRYKKVLVEADQYLEKPFPVFDEATYMRMFTHGDSQAGKDMLANRLRWLIKLTWAESLENRGRYVPKIEEVIDGLLHQKTWVNPRNYLERNHKGLVELSTASYAQNLAQAVYLLNEKLTPGTRLKVTKTIRQRMFDPILATLNGQNQDHGWLQSTNNWNAVCLAGIAGTALTLLPEKSERAQFVVMAERYHQNFMVGFMSDGYCTEGISYYNYGFGRFIALREIVYTATNRELDLFDQPKMAKIARFGVNSEIINNTYPAISDCRSGTAPSRNIIWYLQRNSGTATSGSGQQAPDAATNDLVADVMCAFPITASTKSTWNTMSEDALPLRSYFNVAGILTVRPLKPSAHGMGAVFKGGRNNEHHNHNDVGSYTIAVGKEILMGDPGSIPYTAKTFSPERYTYKSLASYGHPVPLVAGTQQRTGKAAHAQVVSTQFSEEKDQMVMELTSAYEVPALKSLKREFSYSRKQAGQLTVTDEFTFDTPQSFETAIITKSDWKQGKDGAILLTKGAEKLRVNIDSFGTPYSIKSEEIQEESGEPYTRLAVRLNYPVKTGRISISYAPIENP